MDQQQRIEIDEFEIDGRPLSFEQGMILIDVEEARRTRWHACFLHPTVSAALALAGRGTVVAHSADGECLRGRIRLADPMQGAGSLLLHGMGALEHEQARLASCHD